MKKALLSLAVIALIVSCNDRSTTADTELKKDSVSAETAESKQERNKKIALESVNAFSSGNADEALKNASPDIVDYGDGSGPALKGVDSIKAVIKMYMAAFPDNKGENIMAFTDGDYVAVYAEWSGTFKKDLMGMKPTGKSYKVRDVDIFKFSNDGKIIEHKAVQSGGLMMQQVGAKMKK